MKTILFFLCIATMQPAKSMNENSDSIQMSIHKKELELNYLIVDYYLADVQAREATMPIFGLNKSLMDSFLRLEPVKACREMFLKYDDELKEVLEKDDEYVSLTKEKNKEVIKARKQKIFIRLGNTSEEYRIARAHRDKALYLSNLCIFNYIYHDFKAKQKVVDISFIPEYTLNNIYEKDDIRRLMRELKREKKKLEN